MQSKPDGQYHFICHAVNHFSKFHPIFQLVSKEAQVVANGIEIHVFSYFGLPKIIHNNDGPEFVNDIIAALAILWPGKASFKHGAPGHSQSQGLAEQGNNSIENFVSAHKQEKHNCHWTSWLPETQCKTSNIFDSQHLLERVM